MQANFDLKVAMARRKAMQSAKRPWRQRWQPRRL